MDDDYSQVVVNEDGEPIGVEYVYADEPSQEDWYDDDYL